MHTKWSRVRQLWSETRWTLLGIFWLVGLILGVAGFALFARENATGWTAGDILYRTLQLVFLNSGAVDGRVNWMLETARFLLPALTGYTALQALLHLFREQLQWLRLWRLRDHAVVCGLGRRGEYLAADLLQLGRRVVAIDRACDHTRYAELRRQGAILLTGDATDRDVLEGARIGRARYLICLLEQDRQNLQVAFQAYQLTRERRRGILTCIVHLTSPDLTNLIRRSELTIDPDVPFQVETFQPYARAAQRLIQEDPGWQEGADPSLVPRHLLVIGLGRLGRQLIVQAAYAWHQGRQDGRLAVTVLDREAAQKTAALVQEQPQLAGACHLNPLPVELGSTRLLHDALKRAAATQPVQRVYVCTGDAVLSLQVCWSLLQLPAYQAVPIHVRLEEKSGLSGLLGGLGAAQPVPGHLIPFDLYRRTCSAELVVGGLHELLARGLHERYLAATGSPDTGLSWAQLPEAVKEDNRRQANRIRRLLAAAGYQVVPFQDWSAGDYLFAPDEVARMARAEHELWCQARRAAGWRFGPVRDGEACTHPDLVPWEELPEEERKKNETFVAQLPALLARIGFQVERAAG